MSAASAEGASSACVCEVPTPPPADYVETQQSLDALLQKEADMRVKRREEEKEREQQQLGKGKNRMAAVLDAFPYCSAFAPPGIVPIDTSPRPLFMSNDEQISRLRAQIQKEQQEAAEKDAAMEEAQLVALELKCMFLQGKP
ncbi:uncharacterized protein TM35_000131190 [Trypanosoma theileri]|uniref:Uncharacterized protein n=1 Tax=Trypanosoma theileri TaxID=67003 RepID=A0A1X0NWP3_9TRYP|nr:uncharacterized protein TM35_000131190 [Trypanosoma theileri]ORC89115.1 hypothetical protein TM35_000131190 [Trypanosoma theileri]